MIYSSLTVMVVLASSGVPPSSGLNRIYDHWEPRLFVSLYGLLTLVLMILGLLKKNISDSQVLKFFTCFFYYVAEGMTLSGLVFPLVDSSKIDYRSVALWVPFFLLHNSAIDTSINAYSPQYNHWLYNLALLSMLFKVSACVIVVCQCPWRGEMFLVVLPLLSIAIYYCGEKIWVRRWVVSMGQESSPEIHRVVDKVQHWERNGYIPMVRPRPTVLQQQHSTFYNVSMQSPVLLSPIEILRYAYIIHQRFRGLYHDQRCSRKARENCQSFFARLSSSDAFRVVVNQMSFMRDEIYTMALALHSRWGWISRVCSIAGLLVSLFTFIFVVDKDNLPGPDVFVTYQLYITAIIIKGWSLFLCVFLPENMLAICYSLNPSARRWMLKLIQIVHPLQSVSLFMGQFNLLGYCLYQQPPYLKRLLQFIPVLRDFATSPNTHYELISSQLQEEIVEILKKKSHQATSDVDFKWLISSRGEWALENLPDYSEKLDWSFKHDFGRSLCIWITATNLCFSVHGPESSDLKIANQLADYFWYLLTAKSVWFSSVASDSVKICMDTIAHLRFFLQNEVHILDINKSSEAAQLVLSPNKDTRIRMTKGNSWSVLHEGCKLAVQLQKLDLQNLGKILKGVLVGQLLYVSRRCRGVFHTQMLGEERELVTIFFLMTFVLGFGLDKEFEDEFEPDSTYNC